MIRTFLDSGVLIAAARATGVLGTRALALFNDPDRVFVTSDFFADAEHIVPLSEPLGHLAYTEACHAGLSGLDALHIAAAKSSGAEEFITTERTTKPLFRVTGIVIKTIALP